MSIIHSFVKHNHDRLVQAIKHQLRKLHVDASDLDDMTQQTVVTALDHQRSFQGRSSPLTWIVGIATNLGRSYLRRRSSRDRHWVDDATVLETTVSPNLLPDERIALKELCEVVRTLPEEEQRLFEMRMVKEQAPREIAREQGTSSKVVSQKVQLVKRKVRHRLRLLAICPLFRKKWVSSRCLRIRMTYGGFTVAASAALIGLLTRPAAGVGEHSSTVKYGTGTLNHAMFLTPADALPPEDRTLSIEDGQLPPEPTSERSMAQDEDDGQSLLELASKNPTVRGEENPSTRWIHEQSADAGSGRPGSKKLASGGLRSKGARVKVVANDQSPPDEEQSSSATEPFGGGGEKRRTPLVNPFERMRRTPLVNPFESELILLRRAQGMIDDERLSGASVVLSQYDQIYPNGELRSTRRTMGKQLSMLQAQ